MADYTVQAGDTLNKIAAANGTTVKALCEANGIENPDLILVGQELSLGKVSETPKEEAAVPVDAKPEDLETEQAKMQAEAQVIQAEVEEGTFETLGKKLDTGIDNTIEFAEEKWEQGKEIAKKVYDETVEFVTEDVPEFAEKAAYVAIGAGKVVVDETVEFVTEDIPEFAEEKWEQGKKIAKESYEYVADKVNGAIETVKETYDDTKKYVAEKVDGAIETVKETYNETKEYVAEKLDEADNAIREAGSEYRANVNNMHDKLKVDVPEDVDRSQALEEADGFIERAELEGRERVERNKIGAAKTWNALVEARKSVRNWMMDRVEQAYNWLTGK